MSAYSKIWLENDPGCEEVRESFRADISDHLASFKFRIPTRRLENSNDGRRRKSPWWPLALRHALRELGFEAVQINDGVFVRSAEELSQLRDLTERYVVEKPFLPPQSSYREYREEREKVRKERRRLAQKAWRDRRK